MDITKLPFDVDDLLARLRPWVECESPTYDAHRVNAMMDFASRECALSGARIERIAGRMGFGDCVRATFAFGEKDKPGILIMGHLDTVHPVGTLKKLPWRRDGERCYGPAIFDMKGGNFIALEAVRMIRRLGLSPSLPVTFLFTSDEEVGSPSTRDIIEAEAARHKYVLVPEPGRADSGVVTGRYAIARFNLEAIGRPSHAGATLKDGRSAIRIMAEMIPAIEAMTTDACTFSVGVVHGGQWVNCVSSSCEGQALSMAKRQADLDSGVERMLALTKGDEQTGRFIVTRGVTRPVWEPNAKTMALYETAKRLARQIGVDLSHESAGGGSDANFTGNLDIASLDGLGVSGAGAHTLGEHIIVDSLPRRGKLLAGLLMELG
ncbi:M20/M25/M40 family metallo-hydrolase [Terrarubrum flagellatum]|uniref:M20/M25/M40 family metallo-hydrolase n=1 Tax=Terrirubrum flagellatum TaxID=2895980 RepID=UPI0031453F35